MIHFIPMKTIIHLLNSLVSRKGRTLAPLFAAALFVLTCSFSASGYESSHYARSSRLATGKWVRVNVKEDGMQFISKATLQSMGFSDPSKVKVYGYGGRIISEKLTKSMPDDLPQQPVVRQGDGIMFFGVSNNLWSPIQSGNDGRKYSHELNPYSTESCYFLTDSEGGDADIPKLPQGGSDGLTVRKTFRERLFYETEQVAVGVSGRELFGEDFRTTKSRTFTFPLIENVGNTLSVRMTAIADRNSAFSMAANGTPLTLTSSSKSDSEVTYGYYTISAMTELQGSSLQLNVGMSSSGGLTTAYLDYIEVEYDRHLKMNGNELYFYDSIDAATAYEIEGCSGATRLWDVTEPWNIREVEMTLNGNKGTFHVSTPGYHEFVAFNPASRGATPVESARIANQDLHSLETPDMVIITLPEFREQSEAIAELHRRHDNMEVVIVEPQAIYNEFSSGCADIGGFRKFLKMLYDRGTGENKESKLGYCLLMGAATFDNRQISDIVRSCGYNFIPIYQSKGNPGGLGSYSTDDILAHLADENESKGINGDKMLIAVGRIPARSREDANNAVRKITAYIEQPDFGNWRSNVMLVADDQNSAAHLEQSESTWDMMIRNGGEGLKYEKIYLDAYDRISSPLGLTFPVAREKMLNLWKDGVMFINYIGHGSPRTWTHENLLTWSDVNSQVNSRMPFLYAATCEFARWDDTTPSGAEIMLFSPKGGVIAMICPSRSVFISNNGFLSREMGRFFFVRDAEGNGPRMGDIMKNGKNALSYEDSNKLRFCMLGDPALRLKLPNRESLIERIGDNMMEDSAGEEQHVELKALDNMEISGCIVDKDGTPDTSFNGMIELTLMDAEEAIETNGWEDETGNNGKVSYYNDRRSRLFVGKTRVTDGKWTTRLFIPYDIDNNTSPAQILTYAFDTETGNEANGSNENVVVYGRNLDIETDTEGPVISAFRLNHSDFSQGDLVHSEPLVLASFSDPQGINVSDSGIGHKITLTLDRRTYFEDVNQYYSPDIDDPTGGSITYPLSGLEAGDHSLTLTVWDNANNSSSATINFTVGVNMNPAIYDVTSYIDPSAEAVIFTVYTDRPSSELECTIEIFNLNGELVWNNVQDCVTDTNSSLKQEWKFIDNAGRRVPRGIYIYRARVATPEGRHTTKSKKLAVGSGSAK